MARFSLQYHVHGKTDFIPTETVDAQTIEEASAIAARRVSEARAVTVSHDEEMVVVPVGQIQYISIRTVVERRAARPVVRDFDLDVVEPWNAGQASEEAAS